MVIMVRGKKLKASSSGRVNCEKNVSSRSGSESDVALGSIAYALRKLRKSNISQFCTDQDIQFIEKRFENTSRVIFQELEWRNNGALLKRVYRRPLRSDLIAINGQRLSSPVPINYATSNAKRREAVRVDKTENGASGIDAEAKVPTIDNVWQDEQDEAPTLLKNAGPPGASVKRVSPAEAPVQSRVKDAGPRRRAFCRVS